MTLRCIGCALLLGVLAACTPGRSGGADVSPKSSLAIGVAPFEGAGAPGASVPDVAQLLADRLGTRGVERVVGPADLGGTAAAEPAPEEVVEWAARSEVEAVVVGRTTRLGQSLSIDVRVRSGRDGEVVTTYVEEVARAGEVEAAVDRLADRILEGWGRPRPEEARASAPAEEEKSSAFSSDSPISIRSERLEAFENQGERRVVFTNAVHATSGDMTLRSDRLETFYPADASQPERMVATGHVRMEQKGRSASCDEATYYREKSRVICTGNAELAEGGDRVRGEEIIFHLDSDVLEVKGGAFVHIAPKEEEKRAAKGAGGDS